MCGVVGWIGSMRASIFVLLSCCSGLELTPRLLHSSGALRRHPPPFAVSERHNQAYKETIKQFSPLPKDAVLHPTPLMSYVPGPDGGYLVHTSAQPMLSSNECEAIVAECEEWAVAAGGWTST